MSNFFQAQNKLWQRLIGSRNNFSLEARVFHSICLIAIFALAYNVPFNFFIGLPFVGGSCLVSLLLLLFFYYNSRVRLKTFSSIIICGVIGHALFVANYYYNSGINGPSFMLFALTLTLMLATVPRGQHLYWLLFNIILVIGLHAAEYFNPEWIQNAYPARLSRFIDSASSYSVTAILLFFSLRYIKRNYSRERKSAEARALAIKSQNLQILKQNQQLEHVNAEKNKLFSIIAHDLRAPLISIQNYLELLSEYGLDESERKKMEENLLLTTKSTFNMMANLLSWSRAQMEGMVSSLAKHNLLSILQNTLQVGKGIALAKSIEFNYEINESIEVVSDGDMLQLVVRNLVNNAIKFTPKGGNVHVEATVIDNNCQILVSDNGIGIPVESRQHIFTLKAKSSFGTNNEKGVGLGLLLCKEFMELQGGKIWFESQTGSGTVFYILIPAFKTVPVYS